MQIKAAPVGIGFDASTYVTPAAAARFKAAGYQFAIRYLRRDKHVNDDPDTSWPVSLSKQELAELLAAGLGVSLVQFGRFHGRNYLGATSGAMQGGAAVYNAKELGVPAGCTLWVDAEWTDDPDPANVMDYLRAWGEVVSDGGYRPGCYVGWEGLTGPEWYSLPNYRAYWCSAMRLRTAGSERDVTLASIPLPRGWCLYQGWEHSDAKASKGRPEVFGTAIDTDFARYDNLGDRFYLAMP